MRSKLSFASVSSISAALEDSDLADVPELAALSSAVAVAVTEAATIVKQRGVCTEFRYLTRVAGEMLDLLQHEMLAVMPLEASAMLEFVEWAERAKAGLESLAALPDTTWH